MHTDLLLELLPAALVVVAAFLVGYALGERRSRRSRRRLKRELASCNLEVLQVRAERTRLLARLGSAPRRDRLLRLLLRRLRESRDREHDLVSSAAARPRAPERPLAGAERTGGSTALEPKSRGRGYPVTLDVGTRETRAGGGDAVARISRHDRARRSRLACTEGGQREPEA